MLSDLIWEVQHYEYYAIILDNINHSEIYGCVCFCCLPPSLSLAMPALAMLPRLLPRFSCSPSEL